MRLTLRTLLAYLDNTLEPQDAEALRTKLAESGFATQLVQRIRDSLADASLLSPSPEAMGPVEEANVISEYLDSTLPSEQVAEIERACLESGSQLAEAAACHQILTMILGQPAQVSPQLRARIYELPDRKIEEIASGGSFSSVSIPVEQPELRPISHDLPTADVTSARDNDPVQPVGVSDSGVSDAPTRLREAEKAHGAEGGATATAIAGSRARRASEQSKIYGGSIRPSRIAPWIVSLALIGVLMFVMAKAFEPWLEKRTADSDSVSSVTTGPTEEIEVPPEQAPVMESVPLPSGERVSESDPTSDNGEVDVLPAPDTSADSVLPAESDATGAVGEESESEPDMVEIEMPAPTDVSDDPTGDDLGSEASATADVAPTDNDSIEEMTNAAPPVPPTESTVAAGDTAAIPPPNDEVGGSENGEVAKVIGQESLLAALVDGQWMRLEKDMVVGRSLTIACAPTFRGVMANENISVTLVGPAQVQWLAEPSEPLTLKVDFGHILVSASEPDSVFGIQLGDEALQLGFADVDTVVAASVKHFRAPGFDPMVPENRVPLAGVLSVQGTVDLTHDGQPQSLDTGMQWVKRGDPAAEISPVETVPDWIEAPDPTETSIESNARSGLLELLRSEQPLEIALREATMFRRSEVAALAAQTLLNLGRGDVYFGGDGILSEPKQRAYWPDHYMTLLATVDRSAESATELRDSINDMDAANAANLFRLLTGYSQKQLVEGGDEELVELLDSSSMAVRVMALENLHKITGTTLYFRAEQENAIRRGPMIKKWLARLRKSDIRWPE